VLLHTKDDAIDAAHHFIIMVKTQPGVQLKKWMSDAGGEYKSADFDTMLKGQGIEILQSVPYQLQQNGHAEHFNRTIMDKAQALRLDTCLPQSWWEFAVLHAVYLYNRTPIQRLKWKTLFEVVNKSIPDVSHLRVFGTAAYVFLPEDIRANKLAPKSELMIFLGYPDDVKGYVFMRLHNNSLFTAATVLFDEAMFPKCPDLKCRGFTPVGEIPADDDRPLKEVNIP